MTFRECTFKSNIYNTFHTHTQSCSDANNDEDISKASVLNIALVLLKLENILHVPATAVDELLQELHYSLTSASNQVTCCIISDILRNHNLEIGESVIQEHSEAVGRSNPLVKAIEKGVHSK